MHYKVHGPKKRALAVSVKRRLIQAAEKAGSAVIINKSIEEIFLLELVGFVVLDFIAVAETWLMMRQN
ncbi:hypothetical protein [Rufibacter roseus]|uniref:Uncharacterized protein n=1 Tax=Rufibacter roseus TaxID=1567108 RepID=A0ABW2DP67_9BACT|nr:hypothetical protein [Rufibacter roseus]